jgi:hypothetical protein
MDLFFQPSAEPSLENAPGSPIRHPERCQRHHYQAAERSRQNQSPLDMPYRFVVFDTLYGTDSLLRGYLFSDLFRFTR